ncbi:BlaI/MecI/CopY family transcriptional regulator [Actinomadura sp. 3N407]|uniref:BlaI/MecI/CopY family transcriptional regulator n=1 Tax=Actinomadura sp. 3N407 TaxID=3457423 RepID=UPI003FCDCAA7
MPGFGELEAAIMDRVWAADEPVRVRHVVDDLQRSREIAYTTVQTVMEILYRKGWLAREKQGKAHYYWAAASREDYTAGLVEEALATTTDRASALVRLIGRMDSAEVAELRRAIDQAGTESGDGGEAGDAAP